MSETEPTVTVSDHIETAQVRKAPKYSVFLGLGIIVGIITAMILTFTVDPEVRTNELGIVYSDGQVFAFLCLILCPIGAALGGLVALILDRTVGRRSQREVVVDRETVRLED